MIQRYDYAAALPDDALEHIDQHRNISHQVVSVQGQLRKHVLGIDKSLTNHLKQQLNRP